MLYPPEPLCWVRGLGNEFKIADVLSDGTVQLMTEDQARKWASHTLPRFRERFETNVLGEEQTTERADAVKQIQVFEFSGVVFLGRQHIHAAGAELASDGCRYVNVEVERDHVAGPLQRGAGMSSRAHDE